MSIVERKDCRACGGLLETVHDFGQVPVINFGDREDVKAPLHLTKCASCHLVQLKDTVDPKKLFTTYYYRSGQNDTMKAHLRGIVEEVQKRVKFAEWVPGSNPVDIVIDIGSNDGTLLSFYPDSVWKVGFEPSQVKQVPLTGGWSIIYDFFDANLVPIFPNNKIRQAKVITCAGVFYDLDNPNLFLQHVKHTLAPDGLFVIEQAYLPEMLRTNNITNVVHEHLCYYSLNVLGWLMEKNGLHIYDVEFSDINGGVFRVYAHHCEQAGNIDMGDTPEQNAEFLKHTYAEAHLGLGKMQTYTDFIARVFKQAAKLHEFIESAKGGTGAWISTGPGEGYSEGGKTVDCYGASTRGLMLLQVAGLEAKHFRYAVDRDPSKVGKTYMGVPVVSEEQMRKEPPDYLLILPMGFLAEFVARETEALKAGTKMIVPDLAGPWVLGGKRL